MKKVVSSSMFVSTLSTAVVVGVAMVVGRKGKKEKESQAKLGSSKLLFNDPRRSDVEVYSNDSDLGYC